MSQIDFLSMIFSSLLLEASIGMIQLCTFDVVNFVHLFFFFPPSTPPNPSITERGKASVPQFISPSLPPSLNVGLGSNRRKFALLDTINHFRSCEVLWSPAWDATAGVEFAPSAPYPPHTYREILVCIFDGLVSCELFTYLSIVFLSLMQKGFLQSTEGKYVILK